MLNSFPVLLLAGTILGFLSGLGIGGGSLLILWLTLVLGTEQTAARSINLLFFIPAAAVACRYRVNQGTLHIRKLLSAILGGCAGALTGTMLSRIVHISLLKKLFGMLLLASGVRELLYRQKKTSR